MTKPPSLLGGRETKENRRIMVELNCVEGRSAKALV